MSKRLTNEIIDQRLLDNNPLVKRIDNFINNSTPIKWQCLKCNYIWITDPRIVINKNKGCPLCAGNLPLTNEMVDQRLKDRDIKRLDNYINCITPINFQCLICNYIWKVVPGNVVCNNTGCMNCKIKNQSFSNEIIDQKISNKNIKRLGEYLGINSKIEWQCLTCNSIFIADPDSIINNKYGCRQCFIESKILTNEIIDKRLLDQNLLIKRIDDYVSAKININWQCLIEECNYIWSARPDNIVNGLRGCPRCNIPGVNEKLMHQFFKEANLEYNVQFNITKLDKSAPNYKIDAYFPDLKLAIEYNGAQHYEPTSFFGSKNPEEDFQKQQKRDRFIKDICKLNNINLIEIDWRFYKGKSLKYYLKNELIPYIKFLIKDSNEISS